MPRSSYSKKLESDILSRAELLSEIERLRSMMYVMASTGKSTGNLLEISQQLDGLILEYQEFFAKK